MKIQNEKYYTIKQVVDITGYSRQWLDKLRKRGDFEYKQNRPGGFIKIKGSEIKKIGIK